ncbi:uncharacterized protein LOC110440416 [Mizuhopecten yessoensis]|uniref:non-specific serine/threonine protein kinase n=1 Tax=Mizuhopecten yessoensis TaxID=6573 RepID=A0A210PL60_MIZYE|nr:uncharacterized protein LOC110440416 [Mizuhopecten yessoensis]XP_021339156.1 uncharacterized protein LOC110440416 [Mizuhopecten yessoensis]OWF37223.1 serine/threonine-protein kinase pats1 [Mizuhopecten yessoensis]
MDKKPKLVVAIKVGYAYSGYAYSFHDDFKQNPLRIGTFSWHSYGRYTTLKTSSAILCKPDGTFHSFGYSAEEQYRTLGEGAEQWYYFKTFPIYNELDDTSNMVDVTGEKSLLTLDLFSMALLYLRENLMEKLRARLYPLDDTTISWTIVTQQSHNKAFITQAAAQADMKENVTVLTKMEAALTYLQCASMYRARPFKPGTKFLLLDASSTSVELSTCENSSGKVVTTNPMTMTGGGNTLNNGIKSLIETVLGVNDLSEHDDISPLMREFEYKKRKIHPGSKETLVLQLPSRYKDAKPVNKRVVGKTIPGVLDDADFDGKVKLKDGKAHIEFEVIQGIFMACARDVISSLRDLQQKSVLKEVSSIIMIGGYSSSLFLQNAVRRIFHEIRVHTLFESSIADLKGAVIFGHSNGVQEINKSGLYSREKIQHYIKTLQDRTEKARNIRVIIVGQEGVGKSTLCYRLLDEDDDVVSTISSTDGVDIFIQRFLVDMVTKKRVKLDANTETQNVKTRIQQVLLLNKATDNVDELETDQAEQQENWETVQEPIHSVDTEKKMPQAKVVTETPTLPQSGKPPLSVDGATDTLLETIGSNRDAREHWADDMGTLIDVADGTDKPNADQAYLSLWDFGGEEPYYNTHHIFLSSDAIFLVVYNLMECIEGTEQVMDAATKRIKYWIRSAVNYSEKKLSGKCSIATPPVILVGTHLDQLSGTDQEIEQKLDKFEEKLCGMADFQAMKNHIYGFLEVNNNVRNHSGIVQLWSAITQVAPSQSQWEKELPARWLTLEREMMRRKETGEKVMSFEDVVSIGRTCEVEINDETEIHMFLKYLHYTGSILYFGEETENLGTILAKTVILDPQWVAQAFRKIITVPKFVDRKDKRANFLWKMYQQSAILDMEYLKIVWKQDKKMWFWKYKAVILAFMERLGLIARPKKEQEKSVDFVQVGTGKDETEEAEIEEIYLVPSLLSGKICFPREMTDRYAVKTRTLCLVFSDRCVPFPVFDKLLAACIEKFNVLKVEDEICLRRGFGIFRIDGVWSVAICCGSNMIKATIFKQSPIPKIEPGAGLRVRLFVEEALKNIMELYAHRDLKFTYHLHCKANVNEGDVTVPKMELEQRKLLPCCFSCEGDKHFIYRHELQPWFSEARPPVQDEYDEEYDLTSEVLEQCPTEMEMLGVSKLIGAEYFEFFILLGLESTKISQVNIEYQAETMPARFLHMFSTWKKAEGDKATIRRIMDAMKTCGLDTSEVVRRGVFETTTQEF